LVKKTEGILGVNVVLGTTPHNDNNLSCTH
jgi:hypothetical protein